MDLFPKGKNLKLSKKTGKGKKLPNKHTGITDSMAGYALSHEEFPFHYEERLQQFFRLAALIPSLQEGLIPNDGVTLSGDGTCFRSEKGAKDYLKIMSYVGTAHKQGYNAYEAIKNAISGHPDFIFE